MKMLALAFLGVVLAVAQPAAAVEPPQNFAVHETPVPVPEISFEDANGQPKTLADFGSKVVLLNIWATWCAPCRKEMPTLDRLQAKLGGPDFEVVALSIDRAGPDKVKKFFAEIGIEHLALNIDTSGKAMFTLGALGLPMTLLIDREGKEIGRLIGPAEWGSPEMLDFIRSYIAAN
ncbi:TlpA family protein disulfide reductase [Mesorhizobium muleiense]|uniref:TlpA family protein disulfide reductase n=1 Tax=Mesorhizobium muleiense TaxID=1004279 RepID=UPI001F32BDE4|nr:TlpA disulfide reductase family protein [Mesorhizobium muleiense]MCF6113015.1 TlpA family protein disulfide reductase [Mesorhizobium muleiense]